MFQTVSKAGVGMYTTGIIMLLHLIGIDADEGMVTEVVLSAVTVGSFLMWVWGQLDRKDLSGGLWRI